MPFLTPGARTQRSLPTAIDGDDAWDSPVTSPVARGERGREREAERLRRGSWFSSALNQLKSWFSPLYQLLDGVRAVSSESDVSEVKWGGSRGLGH